MSEHECRCAACAPDMFPPLERQGPHHFAVRFGDWWLTPYLGDERIRECTEVFAADDGLAVVLSGPVIHRCQCGEEPCMTVLRGPVSVRLEG